MSMISEQVKEIRNMTNVLHEEKRYAAEEIMRQAADTIEALSVKLQAANMEKLIEYENLEEQGRLLKLPCAIGDAVYEVQELRKRIQPYTVIAVHISNCGNLYGWELKDGKGVYSNVNGFSEYAIGKQVFLTKSEAEQALAEMEGKK